MKYSIILSVAVMALIGNSKAIKLTQKSAFVDDVVKMLDDSEKAEAAEQKAKLAQCNPCPVSSAGANPHWNAPPSGTVAADPSTDASMSGLAQCNPCPNSSAGANPHYTVGSGTVAADPSTDASMSGLAQCNPCPSSSAGANPHWNAPATAPATAPSADASVSALAQCNPCPVSSAGANPHWNAPANAPVATPSADASKLSQVKSSVSGSKLVDDSIPLDSESIKQYASVIADAAEDSEPEKPVVYSETITE